MNKTIDYSGLDNEVAHMKADLELTKYHDRVVNGKLTKEEQIARDNMRKILDMSTEDFMNGKFDDLQ